MFNILFVISCTSIFFTVCISEITNGGSSDIVVDGTTPPSDDSSTYSISPSTIPSQPTTLESKHRKTKPSEITTKNNHKKTKPPAIPNTTNTTVTTTVFTNTSSTSKNMVDEKVELPLPIAPVEVDRYEADHSSIQGWLSDKSILINSSKYNGDLSDWDAFQLIPPQCTNTVGMKRNMITMIVLVIALIN